MGAFLRNSWLTKRTDAWLRETEITHSMQGWHVHTHTLSFSEMNEWQTLPVEIRVRWLKEAHKLGVDAAPEGQHLRVHSGVHTRVNYVTKGLMTPTRKEGHQSVADILADYKRGDAEAGELWEQIESFFGDGKKRNWRSSGGAFRNSNK